MKEIWKDIKGYEGLYQISNMGRVKRLEDNFITQGYKGEYANFTLKKNGISKCFAIHRLVATHFIPNPLNKKEVNHIDGNKHNNCVNNLEWNTHQENTIHSYKTGLRRKNFYTSQFINR